MLGCFWRQEAPKTAPRAARSAPRAAWTSPKEEFWEPTDVTPCSWPNPLELQNRSKSLEIARNRSNLASADVTLQLRLGFWPVKSGQCSNVLPIVSVVGPNYQFQLLPTLNSMIL
mgnify:CR=1 FL=1